GDLVNQFKNKGIVGSDNQSYQLGGFVVSDYVGESRAIYKYNLRHTAKLDYIHGLAKVVNAGIDMLMLGANAAYADPFDYETKPPYKMRSPLYYNDVKTVYNAALAAVKQGLISQERLDGAATHIIAVKLAMANNKATPLTLTEKQEEAKISLQAAEQSLVLLKNDHATLPVKKEN